MAEGRFSDDKDGMRLCYFLAFLAGAWQVKLAALFVSPVSL